MNSLKKLVRKLSDKVLTLSKGFQKKDEERYFQEAVEDLRGYFINVKGMDYKQAHNLAKNRLKEYWGE